MHLSYEDVHTPNYLFFLDILNSRTPDVLRHKFTVICEFIPTPQTHTPIRTTCVWAITTRVEFVERDRNRLLAGSYRIEKYYTESCTCRSVIKSCR